MSAALLYKPEHAAALLGIGRSKLFELIGDGQIETVQIGRSRRIPAEALVAYVERLRSQDSSGAA
jgi:excisionase family DNA binding protein